MGVWVEMLDSTEIVCHSFFRNDCVQKNLKRTYKKSKVHIYTDSQTPIRALVGTIIKYSLV